VLPTGAGLVGLGVAITAYFFARLPAYILLLAYLVAGQFFDPRPIRPAGMLTAVVLLQISVYTAVNLAAIHVLHRLKITMRTLRSNIVQLEEAKALAEAQSAEVT